MKKLATSRDLQVELRRVLSYAESPNPSRERVAEELRELADRVGAVEGEVNLPKLDRLLDSTEDEVKQMRSSLSKYKSDPGKYKPQLENFKNSAGSVFSAMKVMLRSLGETV
jgi:hypothetical protein